MTQRHFCTRINEHQQNGENSAERKSPIRIHTEQCYGGQPKPQDFIILRKVQNPNVVYLSVMEALFIREHKPALNTRDEFKGRQLRIKI